MNNTWPDTEEVLARFRSWLDEAHEQALALGDDPPMARGQSETPAVGMLQLVEQFTALRHELKLQTKSARSLEERSEETLNAMHAAIEQFRSVQANESQAGQHAAKPLAEALVDLDEALLRGRKVIETARSRILVETTAELQKLRDQLDELFRTQSWWRRRLCRPWHEAAKDLYCQRTTELHRGILNSLLEGYELIQNRLRRTLDEQAILRIQCVGQPVDPNSMTVIEVINDPRRPPGVVVEEVRPGYYWKGKVLRFAEVRANNF
jgi:molecular chaperone GrpE